MVIGLVYVAGLHLEIAGGVPAGLLATVALAPMWWTTIGRVEFARLILALSIAALVAGLYLAAMTADDHIISRAAQRQFMVTILGGLAVTIVVLWGRAHFPLHLVAVAYGLGDLTNAFLFTNRSWKYYLAVPTTIVVVGYLGKYRSRAPAIIALVILGFITALDRGRSFFAFCVLATCLIMWESLPASRRTRRWAPAALLVVAGVATYQLAISFLTRGYLGEAAQARTITQVETSGSLLLGGRPQWSATFVLMRERPFGYGLGVIPNLHDYALVTQGFQSLNLLDNGYIRHSMLFGQFRLHSITADLWVRCGILGLVLALTIAFALVRTLSTLIAERMCPPIVALMVILSLWYLAFEPTFSYSRDVFFAIGITLLTKTRFRSPDAGTTPETSERASTSQPLEQDGRV
jgi:hypothetical protein